MPCGFNGDSVDFEAVVVESVAAESSATDYWGHVTMPTSGAAAAAASSSIEGGQAAAEDDLGVKDALKGALAVVVDGSDAGGFTAANFSFVDDVTSTTDASDCVTSSSSSSTAAVVQTGRQRECERRNNLGELCEPMADPMSEQLTSRLLVKCDERIGLLDDEPKMVDSCEPASVGGGGDAKRKPEVSRSEGSDDDDDDDDEDDDDDDDDDEEEELFFQPPRRISMLWNSKFRWREERKKVFKISINKLRKIEDPELFLRRSVLINNTVKRLHREIREEKMARYPEVVTSPGHRGLSSVASTTTTTSVVVCSSHYNDQMDRSIPEAAFSRKRPSPFDYREDDAATTTTTTKDKNVANDVISGSGSSNRIVKEHRRRDAETTDNVKRMRTCGYHDASDEFGNHDMAGDEVASGDREATTNAVVTTLSSSSNQIVSERICVVKCDPLSRVSSLATAAIPMDYKEEHHQQPLSENSFRSGTKERRDIVSEIEKQYSQYSCGQLSIFGELQSVVFHSLIASLES